MQVRSPIARVTDRILVAGFCAALLLPALDMVVGLQPAPRNWTPRPLVAFPPAPTAAEEWPAWPAKVDAWWRQHVGFRRWLVTADGTLRVRGLGVSHQRLISVGRDGWLFNMSPAAVKDYLAEEPLTPADLAQWRRALEERREWLADRGIGYVVTVVPNKGTIYHDKLPRWLQVPRDRTRPIDQITAWLSSQDRIPFVDLRPVLEAGRREATVYLPRDTHWSSDGAYLAYRAIAAQLASVHPKFAPPPSQDFERLPMPMPFGDLARGFALEQSWPNDSARVQRRESAERVWRAAPPALGLGPGSGFVTRTAPGAPRLYLYGDSFSIALEPFLSAHCSRVIFSRRVVHVAGRAGWFAPPATIERARPHVLVEEIAERFLRAAPRNPRVLREQGPARRFRASDRGLLRWTPKQPLPGRPVRHLRVEGRPGSAHLHATGRDPALVLPDVQVPAGHRLVLRAEVTPPQETTLQVFYSTPARPAYAAERSATHRLHTGWNALYLDIPVTGGRCRLRLDPGTVTGLYRLHRLEILAVPVAGR